MIEEKDYLLGYIFDGKFYQSLDELAGRTMSEDNKPVKVYNPAYVEALVVVHQSYKHKHNAIMKILMADN
jgi:hypothetical protein